MIKWFIALGLFSCSWAAQAHQADISTTMIIERDNNQWVVQISAALTAFQYEIKTHYGDSAYATPEAFQELVISHLKDNVSLSFNGKDTARIEHAYVKLGHETNVVFEISGVPADIRSADIRNSSFKDIHRNQSALVLLKKGFSKQQFLLKDANQHTANLVVNGKAFQLAVAKAGNPGLALWLLVPGLLILATGLFAVYGQKLKRTTEVSLAATEY